MGQNKERLDRLKANRANLFAMALRTAQAGQRTAVVAVVGNASAGVTKAARTEGFEGDLGEVIQTRLKKIHTQLEEFGDFQAKLGAAVNAANQALQDTANGIDGLPAGELSAGQASTIEMAAKTGSPVQVSPGVTLTPEQATQWYQDQAEAEQEEAARKLTVALDKRLQEIIDGMPTSEYDPPAKNKEDPLGKEPGGDDSTGYTGPGVSGPGVSGPGGGSGGGGNYDGPGVTGPGRDDLGRNDPPKVIDPVFPGPRDPEVDPPVRPNPTDPEGHNVDGGIDGVVPGTPPGVTPPGLTPPGGGLTGPGTVGPGGGVAAPGGIGVVGGAGLAGGAGRVGAGVGGIGGAGRIGGVGGIGGIGGAGASGTGVSAAGVVQGGAAGGRGGMMAGGMAGAAGGAGGKKNRRRGQDLLALELEDDDEGVTPDLGEAGAAGRSASDGREELGW